MRELQDFIDPASLDTMINRALEEDLGPGDATVLALVPGEAQASAELVAKQDGVIAGLEVFARVFSILDARLSVEFLLADGDRLRSGDTVARLSGPAGPMLSGERTALNFLGHLSGIASRSAELNALVENSRLTLLDTRKTIPLFRGLEKYAVQAGGCANHRRGLYDMIMIKENHLRVAGSIAAAVKRCRERFPDLAVEVETTCLDEVRQAMEAGADRIMFDNMDDAAIRDALDIVRDRAETEASGNMDADRVRALANSGLDFVSLGSLTHTISALDLSMLFSLDGALVDI